MKTLFAIAIQLWIAAALLAELPKPAPARKTNWEFWEKLDQLSGEAPKISRVDADRFVQANGRSTKSLFGAWLASGIDEFGNDLIDSAPDDPLALAFALNEKDSPAADRLLLAKRFQKTAPDNSLPWLIESKILFETNNDADAINAVREALGRKPPMTFDTDCIEALSATYRFAGHSEAEARLCAAMSMSQVDVYATFGAYKGLKKTYDKLQKDDPVRKELMALSYKLSKFAGERKGISSFISTLITASIEVDLIEAGAPPEWNLGEKQIAERDEIRRNAREVLELKTLFKRRSDALVLQYIDRTQKDGELYAWKWLKAQK
jgi:hypothetical protein